MARYGPIFLYCASSSVDRRHSNTMPTLEPNKVQPMNTVESKVIGTETEEQALILWCETCPDWRVSFLYHRVSRPESSGYRSSLPRFYLPVPCGQFQGLYIEMPGSMASLSKEQKTWVRELSSLGYKVEICANSAQAIDAILNYLKIEKRR